MAHGLICDACGTAVRFDSRSGKESATAEESAWIKLVADNVRTFHACTRECAKALLDGEFGELVDAAFEQIAEVARMLREDADDAEGSDE